MSLTHEALLSSPTRAGVPSSDDRFTADDLIAAQDALEAEARDVLPFSFADCTYPMGYVKQPLQLSLYAQYDKNFHGQFCFCGRPYDPQTETDNMYQCLVCEDWLHHACLFGVPADSADSPLTQDDFDQVVCHACVSRNQDGVRRALERYAGRPGTGVMLLAGKGSRTVLGKVSEGTPSAEPSATLEQAPTNDNTAPAGSFKSLKRQAELHDDEDNIAKRHRGEGDEPKAASTGAGTPAPDDPKACRALPSLPPDETPLAVTEAKGGKLHVFLGDDWMQRWCRCSECLPLFVNLPYLLEEEEVVEPEEDPDARKSSSFPDKSTFELGMDALNRLPRAQAIEGAIAFQGLSSRLKEYLRPCSEAGQTVTREMVQEFFEKEKEALADRVQQ
ncbi:hypothetical protein OIV83_006268 [Microbotryomycetes sp. JL201]|nr:hypothetical protein OIV83_006268 [Microbotryomycetes sp. JL201]